MTINNIIHTKLYLLFIVYLDLEIVTEEFPKLSSTFDPSVSAVFVAKWLSEILVFTFEINF